MLTLKNCLPGMQKHLIILPLGEFVDFWPKDFIGDIYKDSSYVAHNDTLYYITLLSGQMLLIEHNGLFLLILDLASGRPFSILVSPWQLGCPAVHFISDTTWSYCQNLQLQGKVLHQTTLTSNSASLRSFAHFLPTSYKFGSSHNFLSFSNLLEHSQNSLKALYLWLWFYHKGFIQDRAWKGFGAGLPYSVPMESGHVTLPEISVFK